MDKFEESIKQARTEYQPSENFTDKIMDSIKVEASKKGHSLSFSWHKLGATVAGMVAVSVLIFTGNSVLPHTSQNQASGPRQTPAIASTSGTSATDEYSSEIIAVNEDFATEATYNSITSDQLNNLTP